MLGMRWKTTETPVYRPALSFAPLPGGLDHRSRAPAMASPMRPPWPTATVCWRTFQKLKKTLKIRQWHRLPVPTPVVFMTREDNPPVPRFRRCFSIGRQKQAWKQRIEYTLRRVSKSLALRNCLMFCCCEYSNVIVCRRKVGLGRKPCIPACGKIQTGRSVMTSQKRSC